MNALKNLWPGKKTFGVFGLSLGAYLGKHYLGIDAIPELDPGVLAVLGILLRLITK